MMRLESCGPALSAMVSLFSGPKCRVAVDAIGDVNALGASVLGAPDAAQAAITEILGLAQSDADAIRQLDALPVETIQAAFVLCLANVHAASVDAHAQQVH